MRLPGLCAVLLAVLLAPPVAAAADDPGCTESAHVRWQANVDRSTVDAAFVELPDCADGVLVGLQLVMEDGDLLDEPLTASVVHGRASFDLTPYAPGIAPAIGVRVMLHPSEDIADGDRIEVNVERRYFNRAGNEQRGLREVERLSLDVGSTYLVTGRRDGYRTTPCDELEVSEDVIGEGVGTFTATEPGRHLVCLQKAPAFSAHPQDQTGALGGTVTTPGVSGPGQPSMVSGPPPHGALARTGAGVAAMLVLAMLMLALGCRLMLVSRRWHAGCRT